MKINICMCPAFIYILVKNLKMIFFLFCMYCPKAAMVSTEEIEIIVQKKFNHVFDVLKSAVLGWHISEYIHRCHLSLSLAMVCQSISPFHRLSFFSRRMKERKKKLWRVKKRTRKKQRTKQLCTFLIERLVVIHRSP